MPDSNVTVLALCGSLRKNSLNRAAFNALVKAAPEGLKFTTFDIGTLPLYSSDLDGENQPESVKALHEAIGAADGILFVTPEYNYTIPGGLKNAIDWASRPHTAPIYRMKAAIMSASMGMLGGARAQYHLRQSAVFLDLHVMNKPEVMIPSAHTKFDDDLNLTDEATEKLLAKFGEAILAFMKD